MKELEMYGAKVTAYDPIVKNIKSVNICKDMNKCIKESEIVVTSTEWSEFSKIDKGILNGKKIFDLRRILEQKDINIVMGVGLGKN